MKELFQNLSNPLMKNKTMLIKYILEVHKALMARNYNCSKMQLPVRIAREGRGRNEIDAMFSFEIIKK
jgi:hypothetical protein